MQERLKSISLSIWKNLEEQGFAIVPGVLVPEAVEVLVTEIENGLGRQARDTGYAMRHLVQMVPAVRKVAQSAAVRALVEAVLGPKAFVARSLLLDKTPEANWKAAWHQDLTVAFQARIDVPGFSAWSMKGGIVHVQPTDAVLERMLTVRLHLDDCDSANGPLQVIPRSHKAGRLNPCQISAWRKRERPTICVVSRGGTLLMRPLLLHASSSATEPRHRRVVHLEFAAESLPGGLEWF